MFASYPGCLGQEVKSCPGFSFRVGEAGSGLDGMRGVRDTLESERVFVMPRFEIQNGASF